ncbi:MAG: hypothetical protein BM555_05870 [Crocinitomix sp. MedPE-SWsnd]|jgi:Family of unknown function (DUF6029)|nr:MAG: hypothetical protein BM555_05870 [Crocinitomix sp. MedPE-SWsnd]
MKKIILPFLLLSATAFGQQILLPTVTGNVETTFQYLNEDTLIGAQQPSEKAVLNSYALVNYSNKGFRAGMRVESYLPHVLGYPDRFSGTGIGYRYVGYTHKKVEFTAGNFYEQFGSGMIFRSYEQRQLGIDNAMDGLSVKLTPTEGFTVKAVYGRMRYNFDSRIQNSDGLVRGVDAEIDFNSFLGLLDSSKFKISVGASFVSKFQNANNAQYNMPKNVGSYGGRINMKYERFFLSGEHIIKENDPSFDNGYIFNNGHATLIEAGYSQKGLGIVVQAKSIDNMSYRVDPDAALTDLQINFLPALTKSHTYNLAATLYPYATQPVGEVAFQADVFYKIPKKTKLGGKYGTQINVNFATAYRPVRHTSGVNPLDSNRVTYKTGLFEKSDSLFYRDINIEIKRKLNKKWKVGVKYFHFDYNNDVNVVTKDAAGIISSHIGVIDVQYKISRRHSIRGELQGLFTKQDKGNWATALIEYNISPKFFFAVMDQWNYGNSVKSRQIHYLIGSAGYIMGASRIMVTYGKQREGIFCIGGVCRPVPATNGLTVTFTSSF